jgi:hypothetical protein
MDWIDYFEDIPEWYRAWWKKLPHVPKTLLTALGYTIFAIIIAFAIRNSIYGGS